MTQQAKLKTQGAEIIDAQPVPAVRQDSGVVLTIIEKMAAMENLDIEKMEKFLEMKERIDDRAREDEDRAAKRDFFADLAMAQRDVPGRCEEPQEHVQQHHFRRSGCYRSRGDAGHS